MIAAALQAMPQALPNLLRPHPWVVAIFVLLGAAMFTYAALGQKGRGPTPPSAPERLKSQIAFEVSPRSARIAYEESPGCWKECASNNLRCSPSLLLEWARSVPPLGAGGSGTVMAIAILRFTHINGSEHVSRAYWLNQRGYEVPFDVGNKETLIVGTVEGAVFASYTNPKWGDLMEDGFPNIPFRQLGPRTAIEESPLRLEISLFDPNADETIERRRFEISFTSGNISVKDLGRNRTIMKALRLVNNSISTRLQLVGDVFRRIPRPSLRG